MTKEKFLTVRWNNLLSLVLGLLTLAYVVALLANPVLSARVSLIWLVVIGAVY